MYKVMYLGVYQGRKLTHLTLVTNNLYIYLFEHELMWHKNKAM